MTNKQKTTKDESGKSCEGMPFAEMMRKMMNQQGESPGFDCAEVMQKMMDQEGKCCGVDCTEMMQKMTTMCCQPQEKKEANV